MGAFEFVNGNKISPTESTEVFNINMASNTTLNEPRRDLESQSENKTPGSRRKLYWMLGTDLPLLVIFFLLLGLFELGVIPGMKNGFYCNDLALSHKYTGDTVGQAFLISTVLAIPLVCMCVIEYVFIHPEFIGQSRVRRAMISTMYFYRIFLYGFILNLGLVEVMKGLMGSPRPDFFAICEPDRAKTCVGSDFVDTYTCTPNQHGWWYQADSYRSFPSGHASLSVYTAFFTSWYLQRRAFNWKHRTTFLVPFLQLVLGSYAAVCALTRITDHRHHWWDVLFGVIIGFLSVFYTVSIGKNFSYNYTRIIKVKPEHK